MTTRVFLVDDHEIVRRGVADLLDREPDLEVVGEAADASHALARIAATRPDVAILDVRLPDGDGIELCREVRSRHPEIGCLILTAYDDDEAAMSAVLAGAAGYVLKNINGSKLVDDVRAVAAGRSLLQAGVTRRVAAAATEEDRADPRYGSLNLRERQVLALIAEGRTNRQIGDELRLAEKTVKNYVSGLLRKLGLERRTQAAVYQLEHRQNRRPERMPRPRGASDQTGSAARGRSNARPRTSVAVIRTQRSFSSGAHGVTPRRSASATSDWRSNSSAVPFTTTLKASVSVYPSTSKATWFRMVSSRSLVPADVRNTIGASVHLVVHGEDVDLTRGRRRHPPVRRVGEATPAFRFRQLARRCALLIVHASSLRQAGPVAAGRRSLGIPRDAAVAAVTDRARRAPGTSRARRRRR
jgi:DNA-binding NarL/FixJ family response regulator